MSVKLPWYGKSPYDLTRSIAEDLSGGKNTMLTRTVEKYGLHPLEAWTPGTLEERHRLMLRMVQEVWQVQLEQAPVEPNLELVGG